MQDCTSQKVTKETKNARSGAPGRISLSCGSGVTTQALGVVLAAGKPRASVSPAEGRDHRSRGHRPRIAGPVRPRPVRAGHRTGSAIRQSRLGLPFQGAGTWWSVARGRCPRLRWLAPFGRDRTCGAPKGLRYLRCLLWEDWTATIQHVQFLCTAIPCILRKPRRMWERGCVRSTSRSTIEIPTRCGWSSGHSRAPLAAGSPRWALRLSAVEGPF